MLSKSDTSTEYGKLTPRMAWNLAAPHTWPASIFPVLMATVFAYASGFALSFSITMALLAISVLAQSAVNAINDYFDFVKGSDSDEDYLEPDDSVLVYNNVNPKSARNLALCFLLCALALGLYCIWYAGWIPLIIAAIGVVAVFLYSGGKTPISYLPIGELVSGFVMGALITFASYIVIARQVNWIVLAWSIPLVIGIGLIMLTNNTCDIEKDIKSQRRTLSVLIGRKKARNLYRFFVGAWYASIIAIVAIWFTSGIIMAPFMLLATYAPAKAILSNPLISESRIAAMSQICSMNIALGAFYALAVAASGITIVA